jgi:hypothetical protein
MRLGWGEGRLGLRPDLRDGLGPARPAGALGRRQVRRKWIKPFLPAMHSTRRAPLQTQSAFPGPWTSRPPGSREL